MDPTHPESCHGRNAARNVDRDDTIQQKMQDFDPVTVLDLQCLDLDKLGEVCKDWGLFRLVNRDVPFSPFEPTSRPCQEASLPFF